MPAHFANQSLQSHYGGAHYVAIGASGRHLYLETYGGYEYDKSDFQYLRTTPYTSKAIDTGGFHVYHVAGNTSA